ncbi:MFS transporter [Streptomyces arenae]|uniref:MFS transporter n=1 Tax=Streptomyces arenae TaxID=29301 RepID=UPI002657EA6B|nr:MFS transporter [Streptomyces arenae]MCG7204042.1 MFS transporter [Streptomyces arenae]
MTASGRRPARSSRNKARNTARNTAGTAVFLVLMVDSVVTGLFVPLSLLYLSASSDASLVRVGTLLSLAGLLSLPLPLWIGPLVDRHGPRPTVLAAQLLQAAGFLGYLVVRDDVGILVAATIASLGQRAFWSSAFTLVSNVSDGDPGGHSRERWFGIAGSLRAAGYGVGAVAAGVALSVKSGPVYRGAIGTCAVLLLMAALLLVRGVPRSATLPALTGHAEPGAPAARGRGYRELWADRPYLGLVALNTAFALCNVMLSIAFPPFVERRLPEVTWAVGPLLAMNTVVQAVLQTTVVRLIRPLPRHRSLCLAGVLWAAWAGLTAGPLWLPRGLWVPCLTVAVLCYSAAQLVHSPVSNALSADAAPAGIRGRYIAVFQYSFAVATVVAPLLFSLLLDVSGVAPWVTLAALALVTVPGALALAPRLPPSALMTAGADGPSNPAASPHRRTERR